MTYPTAEQSFLDLADELGDMASMTPLTPIERPQLIETAINYPSRQDLWPPEIWAEMEAIRRGEA